MRLFSRPKKISKKVICIGNLIAGGAGKTPTAIAIGKILQEINIDFAFLTRGYMNDGSRFLMLKKSDNINPKKSGDEAIILSKVATTFIAKSRVFGALKIEEIEHFKAIILDDGAQNKSLYHDFKIIVIDGLIGFGNEFLIPAGPMREMISSGLKKADLVVLIGETKIDLWKKIADKNLVKAKIVPKNLDDFRNKKLFAFCGLGYPQKFFSFLANQGLEVNKTESFGDHYFYKNSDLENLISFAQKQGLHLITTQKDWVKFSTKFQKKIPYLDIELIFEDHDFVKEKITKIFEY